VMKQLSNYACCLIFLGTINFSSGADPKAEAKRMLTLRAAAEKARTYLQESAEVNEKQNDAVSTMLSKEMLKQVKKFSSKKDGQGPGKEWLSGWRLKELEKSVDDAWEWAKDQSPLPVNRVDVIKRATKNWAKDAQAKAAEFAEKSMNAVYDNARRLAADEQLRSLKQKLNYPSKDELNKRIMGLVGGSKNRWSPLNSTDFEKLDTWLKTVVGNAGPVFEELNKEVGKMSSDLRLDVGSQYQAQYKSIQQMVEKNGFPKELITKEQLKAHALNLLRKSTPENLAAKPPRYGVFSAMENLVENAASHWEAKRMEIFAKARDEWLPDNDQLEQAIRGDLAKHAPLKDSLKLLTEKFLASANDNLATLYGGKQWATYFKQALAKQDALLKNTSSLFRKVVSERVKPIREKIAGEQFAASFSILTEKSFPGEPMVVHFFQKGKKSVTDFNELADGLNFPAPERPSIIEETRILAGDRANRELVPALSSMDKQVGLVREVEKKKIDQLKEDVEQGRSFTEILKEWEKEWDSLWSDAKKNVPERWRSKFNHTDKALNKAVRQLYESMQNNPEGTPKNTVAVREDELGEEQEDTPNESVPVENEQPEQEDKNEKSEQESLQGMCEELKLYIGLADGVFAFSDSSDGKCRMLFGTPDGVGAFSVKFDPQQVEVAANQISESLKKPLGLVLDGNARMGVNRILQLFQGEDQGSEIKMLFKVSTPAVRHQMSILVRQQVEEAIDAWAKKSGRKAPDLIWQDDVEL
jgi:hypothetical protein